MRRHRTFAVAAAAAFLFPLTIYSLARQGALRSRDLQMSLDPFEIDLQLFDRND